MLLGLTIQTINELWSSDVFEHLAVVRELTSRPFDPRHPLLALDVQYPVYSPYTIVLGVIGNVTGLGAVSVLKLAAIGNAVFLLVAYRRFASVITGQRHAEFFGLLALLLLWGPTAWRLSGFLNLNSIGYGLPYPSTFATALMLVALAEVDLVIRNGARWSRLVVLALSVATILVTHPITGIATAAGIAAVWVGRGRGLPRRTDWPLLGALGAAVLLVTVWPYYSFWSLLLDNGEYAESNFQLYEGLPLRLAPLAILVVFLIAGRLKPREEPLIVWASFGAVLYLVGLVTGQYVLGRTLAFIALAILTKVGAVTAAHLERPQAGRERALVITAAGLAVIGLAFASPALLRMMPRAVMPQSLADDDRLAPVTAGYGFMPRLVPDDTVVAAWPNELSDVTPAFAGKVLATPKPVPFVDDVDQRRAINRRIFDSNTDQAERRRLVTSQQVDFILFDEDAVSERVGSELMRLGSVVYNDDGIVLVAIPAP